MPIVQGSTSATRAANKAAARARLAQQLAAATRAVSRPMGPTPGRATTTPAQARRTRPAPAPFLVADSDGVRVRQFGPTSSRLAAPVIVETYDRGPRSGPSMSPEAAKLAAAIAQFMARGPIGQRTALQYTPWQKKERARRQAARDRFDPEYAEAMAATRDEFGGGIGIRRDPAGFYSALLESPVPYMPPPTSGRPETPESLTGNQGIFTGVDRGRGLVAQRQQMIEQAGGTWGPGDLWDVLKPGGRLDETLRPDGSLDQALGLGGAADRLMGRVNQAVDAGAVAPVGAPAPESQQSGLFGELNDIGKRLITQPIEAALYTPAGLYALATDPVGTGKAMWEGVKQDFTNPAENAGYLAMDLLGIAGLGAGAIARTSRAARAAAAGENPVRAFVTPGLPGRRPSGALRSGAPLSRWIGDVAERAGLEPRISRERTEGVQRARTARVTEAIERAPARALLDRASRSVLGGRKLSLAQQTAIRVVAERVPVKDRIAKHAANYEATSSKQVKARLQKKIGLLQTALRYINDSGDAPVLTDPKLQEVYDLAKQSSERGADIAVELGLLDPETAQARLSRPGEVFTGERVEGDFFTSYAAPRRQQTGPAQVGDPVVGIARSPLSRQPMSGASIERGTFRDDTVRMVADSELARQRYGDITRLRKDILADSLSPQEFLALPDKERGNYRGVRVRGGRYTQGTRQALDRLLRKTDDGVALTKKERRFLEETAPRIAQDVFPDGETPELIAWAMDPTSANEIRFFDKRKYGQQIAAPPASGIARSAGDAVDTVNQLAQISLLFTKPGYVPPNLAGQALILAIEQGPVRGIYNMARGIAYRNKLTPEEMARMRGAMGEGFVGSLTPRGGIGGVVGAAQKGLARGYSTVLDDPWRDAAFLGNAQAAGYRSLKDVKRLLNAQQGTKTFDDLVEVAQRANEAAVEFGRLGKIEQDFVRRIVFFYPWLKASTMYTMRLPREHPTQTAMLTQLGREGQEQTEAVLGEDVAQQFPGVFPTNDNVPFPRVIEPQAAALFQAPAEIASLVSSLAGGNQVTKPGDYFSPAASLATQMLLGYDSFTGRELPADQSRAETALNWAKGLSPWVRMVERMQQPDDELVEEGKLYGYSDQDALAQNLFGSWAPRNMSLEKAEEIAAQRSESGLNQSQRILRDAKAERENWLTKMTALIGADDVDPQLEAVLKRRELPKDLSESLRLYTGWQTFKATYLKNLDRDATARDRLAAIVKWAVKQKKMTPAQAKEALAYADDHGADQTDGFVGSLVKDFTDGATRAGYKATLSGYGIYLEEK